MINKNSVIKYMASIFLVFYALNLIEFMLMYDNQYQFWGLLTKATVSIVLIMGWNYVHHADNPNST